MTHKFDLDDIAEACCYAEVSDAQYQTIEIYLLEKTETPLHKLKAMGYTEEDLDASNPYTQHLTSL